MSVSITLSDDLRQENPIAWMVYSDRDCTEWELFPYLDDAESAAEQFAADEADSLGDENDIPAPKPWPVYALWAADLNAKPEVKP